MVLQEAQAREESPTHTGSNLEQQDPDSDVGGGGGKGEDKHTPLLEQL